MLASCIFCSAARSSVACIWEVGKPIRPTAPWSTKLTKTRSSAPDLSTLPPAESSPVSTLVNVSGVTSVPL